MAFWKRTQVDTQRIVDLFNKLLYYSTDPKKPVLATKGEVTLINSDGEEITSFNSSNTANSSDGWTTASGAITATANDGTKTITFANLPFTLTAENIAGGEIKRITSAGVTTVEPLTTISVSGNILTLADSDDFVSTDTISATLKAIDKAYDINQDVNKVNVENPEWDHYTSIEHIVDDTDATLDQHYSPEIQMEGWRNLILQLTGNTGTGGVVFTAFGTINPDAATPADGDAAPSADWVDISTTILGAASITLNGGASDLFFVPEIAMVDRMIIRYDCDHATNSTDIFIRRF